jgi:hypothetical protein
MKTLILYLAVAFAILTAGISQAGYVNTVFKPGDNLFSNPLDSGQNTLDYLFSSNSILTPNILDGATISLWNPTNSSFDTTSIFTNGYWTKNLALEPGTGAKLNAPLAFTNTFVGVALNHDGSPLKGGFTTPPLFTGPNGIYLLGDKCPTADIGTNVFLNIIGRLPYVGEQVIRLSGTNTYLGNGLWDSVPTLGLGEAVFLNVMSEPQPWLTIAHTNNQAVISWPSSLVGWTLQTNDDLTSGTWGNYGGLVIDNTVTNSTQRGNLFFRLFYP